jgi:hypothetical protein
MIRDYAVDLHREIKVLDSERRNGGVLLSLYTMYSLIKYLPTLGRNLLDLTGSPAERTHIYESEH